MRPASGLVAVFVFAAACASAATKATTADESLPTGTRIDRTMLTKSQFGDLKFNTAYDAVEALRSNWLKTKGTDSFQNPSQVRVYLDNISLGDIETLRTITISTIVY